MLLESALLFMLYHSEISLGDDMLCNNCCIHPNSFQTARTCSGKIRTMWNWFYFSNIGYIGCFPYQARISIASESVITQLTRSFKNNVDASEKQVSSYTWTNEDTLTYRQYIRYRTASAKYFSDCQSTRALDQLLQIPAGTVSYLLKWNLRIPT